MSTQADEPSLRSLAVINGDGSRKHVHPADVRGRFTRLKPWVRGALIAFFAALPWIEIGAHPAVFINIAERRFFLFGLVFNAQDAPLLFFALTGLGFGLIFLTAVFGRVWCGWACPQTVFLEGVYRKVERMIDGPRAMRLRQARQPWTRRKISRAVLKQAIFVLLSLSISHLFVAYFVSIPRLYQMMTAAPSEHWTTFLWMAVIAGVLYFNFAWFREQLCLIICPYGRLQSALQDDDSMIIGYDEKRGEPRGKAKNPTAGDCVDCKRCVVVCPTGIDIRQGLQMECIACAACIDACNDVMVKLGRDQGLLRYDTHRGFTTGKRRLLRPRLVYYALAGLAGFAAATIMVSHYVPFEANILRVQGPPYSVTNNVVLNQLMVHVVNKQSVRGAFEIRQLYDSAIDVVLPQPRFELEPFGSLQVPVLVRVQRADLARALKVRFKLVETYSQVERTISIRVLGPPSATGPPPSSTLPISKRENDVRDGGEP